MLEILDSYHQLKMSMRKQSDKVAYGNTTSEPYQEDEPKSFLEKSNSTLQKAVLSPIEQEDHQWMVFYDLKQMQDSHNSCSQTQIYQSHPAVDKNNVEPMTDQELSNSRSPQSSRINDYVPQPEEKETQEGQIICHSHSPRLLSQSETERQIDDRQLMNREASLLGSFGNDGSAQQKGEGQMVNEESRSLNQGSENGSTYRSEESQETRRRRPIYESQKNHVLKNFLQALKSPILKYIKKYDENLLNLQVVKAFKARPVKKNYQNLGKQDKLKRCLNDLVDEEVLEKHIEKKVNPKIRKEYRENAPAVNYGLITGEFQTMIWEK